MIDVLKIFYPFHYNFAAFSVLLVIIIIWLLTKKNYKWTLITAAVLVAFNIAIYMRTEGKTWTIIEVNDPVTDNYGNVTETKTSYTFSVHDQWTVTDENGTVHHWCWVEDYWQRFSGFDVISAIWGENASKKMIQSSEDRLNDVKH